MSEFDFNPNLIDVLRLNGYHNGIPDFDKRIGVYIPERSKIVDVPEFNIADLTTESATALLAHGLIYRPGDQMTEIKPKTPETLSVYVSVTDLCNLSCVSCVTNSPDLMASKSAKTFDGDSLQSKLCSIISEAGGLGFKKIKVKYAGGEPTLSKPLKTIFSIQEKLKQSVDACLLGLEQVIHTNGIGLNDPEVVKKLKRANIFPALSIWGDINQNKRGDKIVDVKPQIALMQKEKLPFSLHHVVTADAEDGLAETIKFAWDNGEIIPLSIAIYRSGIVMDEKQCLQILKSTRNGFSTVIKLHNQGKNPPVIERLDYLQPFKLTPLVCGAGRSYLAISPRGTNSCHEHMMNSPLKPKSGKIISETFDQWELTPNSFAPNSPLEVALDLHGGQNCPNRRDQNLINLVYKPIFLEMLSLAVMCSS